MPPLKHFLEHVLEPENFHRHKVFQFSQSWIQTPVIVQSDVSSHLQMSQWSQDMFSEFTFGICWPLYTQSSRQRHILLSHLNRAKENIFILLHGSAKSNQYTMYCYATWEKWTYKSIRMFQLKSCICFWKIDFWLMLQYVIQAKLRGLNGNEDYLWFEVLFLFSEASLKGVYRKRLGCPESDVQSRHLDEASPNTRSHSAATRMCSPKTMLTLRAMLGILSDGGEKWANMEWQALGSSCVGFPKRFSKMCVQGKVFRDELLQLLRDCVWFESGVLVVVVQ